MGLYTVRAVSQAGRSVTLRETARSEDEVARALKDRGYTLTRVVRFSDRTGSARKSWKVSRRALADFTDRLQILYAAGVPVVEALEEIARGATDPRMKAVATRIQRDLEDGQSFTSALDRFPNVFSPAYRSAVKAGEQSGALDVVLRRLIAQLEWEQWIGGSIRQAFVYPAILFTAILGLLIFLFTFLLPRLMKVFEDARVELPLPTRIVIGISDFLAHHWALLLLGCAGMILAYVGTRRSAGGRIATDGFFLKLPIVGSLLRKVASARFVATLRTLHQSGTPMLTALELSRDAAGNASVAKDVSNITALVEDGVPLTKAMAGSQQLEPLVPRMVAVGEMSGSISESLDHVVKLYDKEIQATTKRMLAFLEPLILIVAGGVVGFVVFATLLPIFRLLGAIKK